MDTFFLKTVNRIVERGTLTITTASGASVDFGDGSGPPVGVRFTSPKVQRRILADPELRLGEAYVDGEMVLDRGTIADLLDLLLSQDGASARSFSSRFLAQLRRLIRRGRQRNRRARSKCNVAHHYDLDGRLYDHFLDNGRQYSCAYFESSVDTLDEAQRAKERHIAAKLLVNRNARVLDIGCGWGGLSLFLADVYEAHVTGVTLSEEQLGFAKAQAAAAPHGERADFRLLDYRDVRGQFERIVSVGMFEHVGVGFYDEFFRKCRNLLTEDGVLLLHSIGRVDPPGFTNPWIEKYIFPGGYIPALSEVLPAVERSGLIMTDVEILRLHYAETLRHWRERFVSRRAEVIELYDERFVRLWEFYLAASEMAFRHQGMMVFQMQIAKRQGAVPLTRDYIGVEEARLRAIDDRSAAGRSRNVCSSSTKDQFASA